jgi:hypothetical protein
VPDYQVGQASGLLSADYRTAIAAIFERHLRLDDSRITQIF